MQSAGPGHAQATALRALAATHPDPVALLAMWRQSLAEAEIGPTAAYARGSAYLVELCRAHADDWTAELVELTLPKLDNDRLDASDGSAATFHSLAKLDDGVR